MFRGRSDKEARTGRARSANRGAGSDAIGRAGDASTTGGALAATPSVANEPFTYIQRGTTIVGQLEARGRVRVHGVVKGDVRVDGALEVAEAGLVEGARIEADDVKIIGRVVVDKLVARGKVEIWDGGELIGDVQAASLDIEEGARFTGRSDMTGAAEANSGAVGSGTAEAEPRSSVDGARRSGVESAAETLLEAVDVAATEVGSSAERP